MKKNILILTTVSGFLDKFERENVKILQEMGYQVHYAANMQEQIYAFDESEIRALGVILHHVDIAKSPYMLKANIKAFWQLMRLVKQYDIQTIHCHTPVGGLLGRLLGRFNRRRKLKVIYTAHGFHFYKGAPLLNNTVYYMIERLMAANTDTLIVINKEDYDYASRFQLKRGGELYHIPGVGLDMEKFAPMTADERAKRREALGIGPDDFFIVSVGELNENKNQTVILQALLRMRALGKDISAIKYGICGDGFYRERIKKMIWEEHLDEQVMMYGYCADVRDYAGCADVIIFPSRREGLGMAGLESLAMEVPVIAADNRGTREYMQNGRNGYVCGWNDVDGFIKRIEDLRTMDAMRREEMKAFCRDSVMHFEKSRTNAMMAQIYQRMDRQVVG